MMCMNSFISSFQLLVNQNSYINMQDFSELLNSENSDPEDQVKLYAVNNINFFFKIFGIIFCRVLVSLKTFKKNTGNCFCLMIH